MSRRLAREIAVQCLFQMEMNNASLNEAIEFFNEECEQEENEVGATAAQWLKIAPFTRELVIGVHEHLNTIDELVEQHLTGWSVDRLSKVDRQILRLAAYEMAFREDIPSAAAINEAVDMAKHYGTDDSGKFVNGVLGQLLIELEKERA